MWAHACALYISPGVADRCRLQARRGVVDLRHQLNQHDDQAKTDRGDHGRRPGLQMRIGLALVVLVRHGGHPPNDYFQKTCREPKYEVGPAATIYAEPTSWARRISQSQ